MALQDFYKSPLTIYVVWHIDNTYGLKYAEAIYNTFCRDTYSPLTRGLGIPVRFRFKPSKNGVVPINIDETISIRNVILLLADDKMFLDANWYDYIQAILDKEDAQNRVFPVALSTNAFYIDENRLNKKQYINLTSFVNADKEIELKQRIEELKSRLLHDMARMFFKLSKVSDLEGSQHLSASEVQPPVKLFLSHAKMDGEQLAMDFRNYILSTTRLKTFFDTNDIEDAGDFEKAIVSNLRNCAIVVFLSDAYSTREWCRIEVIVAKRNKSPMVVVNNVEVGERRSFPYLGNVPTIQYKPDCFNTIIDLALFQVLNNLYLEEKIKAEVDLYDLDKNFRILFIQNAPELFNYLDIKRLQNDQDNRRILVIYPDPPLGTEELKVLNDLDQHITFITPTLIHNILPDGTDQ